MVSDSERREPAPTTPESAPSNPLQAAAAGIVGLGFVHQENDHATDVTQMRFSRREGGQTIVVGIGRGTKSSTAWLSVSTFGPGRAAACDMSSTEVETDRVTAVLSAHLTAHGLAKEIQVQTKSALDGSAV